MFKDRKIKAEYFKTIQADANNYNPANPKILKILIQTTDS
jgi:hypothetical protein